MDTFQTPNGYTSKKPKNAWFLAFWLSAYLLGVLNEAAAQNDNAYLAILRFGDRTDPLTGILYAVNDTAIVILPSILLSPKQVPTVIEKVTPVSIPTRVIKKVKVMKVRSFFREWTIFMLLEIGLTAAYLASFPDSNVLVALGAALGVTTVAIFTADYYRSKRFRPKEPGFVQSLQKYCLKGNEAIADR